MTVFQVILVVILFETTLGKLTCDIQTEANPEICANFRVNIENDRMTLTTDIVRVIEGKIMFKFDFYKLSPRLKLMDVPKKNYCNFRRNLKTVPLVSDFIEFIDQYGNWTSFCPWKPGRYGLWNMPIDDHLLPMKNMIQKGRYLMTNNITYENGVIERIVDFRMTIEIS